MIIITIEIRVMIVDEVFKAIVVVAAVEEEEEEEEEMADFQIVVINKETIVVLNDEMTEVVHVV